MKILLLTSNDGRTAGGQQIKKLRDSFLARSHNVLAIINAMDVQDESEYIVPRNIGWRIIDRAVRWTSDVLCVPDMYRPSFKLWLKKIDAYRPDIIHIHWTYSSYCIPLLCLPSLSKRFPILWTYHDVWAITGGCTYNVDCIRWKTGCGNCPQLANPSLNSFINLQRDTTAMLWNLKRNIYKRSRFTIICPSLWLTNMAKQSPLLQGKTINYIPNGLNTQQFHPLSKKSCREALDIPQDKHIILFIGKPDNIFGYGGRIPVFVETMKILKTRYPDFAKSVELLIVGKKGEDLGRMAGYPAICLGAVSSRQILAMAHSAADIFVNTTQADNLPGVIQESLACGTPIIASKVDGVIEMVRHMETGYLAKRDDPNEFAEAIRLLFSNDALRLEMGRSCRQFALSEYENEKCVSQILTAYEEEIARHRI